MPKGWKTSWPDRGILLKDFKEFGPRQAQRLKEHAEQRNGGPVQFLRRKARKDELALQSAHQQGLREGLITVVSCLETCPTFRLRYGKGRPRLQRDWRRCLVRYFYFLAAEFGLLPVRLVTWFPLTVQVYVNGHEGLARPLRKQGVDFEQRDNVFLSLGDGAQAQQLADQLLRKPWPGLLHTLAKRCNPLLGDLLHGLAYRWVTDQAEFALDILFQDAQALASLYPRLLEHAAWHLGGEDILRYLGRKRPAACRDEVLTDLKRYRQGFRVKHRYQGNWIKLYDQCAQVLRIEVVINHPASFRVRRWSSRPGQRVLGCFPLLKSVAFLDR